MRNNYINFGWFALARYIRVNRVEHIHVQQACSRAHQSVLEELLMLAIHSTDGTYISLRLTRSINILFLLFWIAGLVYCDRCGVVDNKA